MILVILKDGREIIETFTTKKEAIEYIEKSEEKKRLFIYYEPDLYKDKPYTVNID